MNADNINPNIFFEIWKKIINNKKRISTFVILIVIEKKARDKSIRKIKIEKFLFLIEFSYSKKTEKIISIIIWPGKSMPYSL